MRGAWAVCKREFAGYFVTPVGYVVLGVYAVITGLAFVIFFLLYARMTQDPGTYGYETVPGIEEHFIGPMLVFCGQVLVFVAFLLSMRLMAEEKSRGTIELLFTYPLRDRDIIFGKYLATLLMVAVLTLVPAVHMALVAAMTPIEPAVLLFGLFAVFLMGAAFFSLALYVSTVARNPLTAGILTFGAFFVSYVLGAQANELPEAPQGVAGWSEGPRQAAQFAYGLFRSIVQELPLDAHAKDMTQGIVAPADVAYYVLFTAFFLFLTFRALELRRGRAGR